MKPVNPNDVPKDVVHAEVQAAQRRLLAQGIAPYNLTLFLSRAERQSLARDRARGKAAKKKKKAQRKLWRRNKR